MLFYQRQRNQKQHKWEETKLLENPTYQDVLFWTKYSQK